MFPVNVQTAEVCADDNCRRNICGHSLYRGD